MADACEHAEHAAEPEIGAAIPPRLFRPCVLEGSNQRWHFEPGAHVAARSRLEARGSSEDGDNFPACESRPRRGMPLSHVGAGLAARTYRVARYCCFSATSGSSFIARRAGIQHPSAADSTSTIVAIP